MKKILLIIGLTISSHGWAANDTCTMIKNTTNVFDAPIIKTCQRIPDGIMIQLNARDDSEKKLALAMLAVSFGQDKHVLSDKKYSMYIYENDNKKLQLPWKDALALQNLFKKKRNIELLSQDIDSKFITLKNDDDEQNMKKNTSETTIPLSNTTINTRIIKGLPPPPPRL